MTALIRSQIFLMLIGLGISVQLAGCEKVDDPFKDGGALLVDPDGYSKFDNTALSSLLSGIALDSLSEEEISGLTFMREEEKLARDVYSFLYDKWNLRIFDNIARSESTHMEAMLILLERYQLKDPANGMVMGEFKDPMLQQLYNELTLTGSESENESLKVGALIEEIDILDLQQQLDLVVDNQHVIFVFQNLQRGSRNHLRAFVRNMEARGYTYSPQRMTQGQFDAIIDAPMERGNL